MQLPNYLSASKDKKGAQKQGNITSCFLIARNKEQNRLSTSSLTSRSFILHKQTLKNHRFPLDKKDKDDFDTKSVRQRVQNIVMKSQRANTVKSRFLLKRKQTETDSEHNIGHDYNQNLLRLKVEEMIFKFKTRIGTLLREMNISVTQLSRFTSLNRIDQILDFLSQKVKFILTNNQIQTSKTKFTRNKEQQLLIQYEIQLQSLKKKQQEKELLEKTFKQKIRQSQGEVRDLYERITRKERDCSAKMTQIYQLKSMATESQKLIKSLNQKCASLQNQCQQFRQANSFENKQYLISVKNTQEQNEELKQKVEELNDMIERQTEKQDKMAQLNKQQSEQIERWRERFQSERIRQPQRNSHGSQTPSSQGQISSESQTERKEQISIQHRKAGELTILNQNSRLIIKVKELQRLNKQLTQEILNSAFAKQKNNELITQQGEGQETKVETSFGDKINAKTGDKRLEEVEDDYKKRIEEVALQWRQKLVEMVDSYEQEGEVNLQTIKKLTQDKEELQQQVHDIAIEKYKVETSLIEKQRQIYELEKQSKKKQGQRINSIKDVKEGEYSVTVSRVDDSKWQEEQMVPLNQEPVSNDLPEEQIQAA